MKPIFQVAILWLAVILLGVITEIAYVASSTRADCGKINRSTSMSLIINFFRSDTCTIKERISTLVHGQSSYFQSAHIIIVHAIAGVALTLFKPSLSAMIWSTLESSEFRTTGTPVPTMAMGALDNGVLLTNSPGFWPAILYVRASRSINHPMTPIFLVILISILSLISPLALSPVYRPRQGPYSIMANISIGGGVGTQVSSSLNLTDYVSQGQVAGRAIINSATALKTPIPLLSFDISAAPFIPQDTVQAIWEAKVETVVAYNSIDCGPSAPSRFTRSQDIVSFGQGSQSYFAAQGARFYINPSFAGQTMGALTNEPMISAVYLNTTTSVRPGAVQAQSSIIFLAANGTLEGAQQRITSPEPTARIKFVDVLVCTSNTTLEISSCSINHGSVTSCVAVQPASIPGAQSSGTGGVEKYISYPTSVASILATSPVMTYYDFGDHIPSYDTITPEMISARIPPLSFMSYDTTADDYHIPMSYVKGVLFGQTAQGLVQGILTNSPANATQQMFISSTFGTSKPVILYIVLVTSVCCALTVTLANWSARQAVPMDVRRILAISRDPKLDTVFEPYSEPKEMDKDEKILNAKVGYTWIDSPPEGPDRRRALRVVISEPPTHASWNDTDVHGRGAESVVQQ